MPRATVVASRLAGSAHVLGVAASVVAMAMMWQAEGRWLIPPAQRVCFTALAVASTACCFAALVAECRRGTAPLPVARHLFVAAVLWAAAQWILSQRFHAVLAWLSASAVLLGFAVVRLTWARLAAWWSRGIGRALDRTAFQVCLAVVLCEGGLRLAGHWSHSPLFGLFDENERAIMQRFAMAPGTLHHGFPCNASGHYDEPFVAGTGQGDVVVSIADSFAVGCVPHRFHFTTVCEQQVEGLAVHNLGISAIGPAGYHHLLTSLGLRLQPDAVVVSLFVGNDLSNSTRWQDGSSVLASLLDRRFVRSIQLPLRLARAWDEPAAHASAAAPIPATPGHPTLGHAAARWVEPAWLDDPMQEPPLFTPQTFLDLEVERARLVEEAEARGFYRTTLAALRAMRAACGKVPFGVLLIPDEFQVEDELWAEVVARGNLTMPRDDPQRRLAAWLTTEGIPHVDLLPHLAAVPPLADGRRHVYHLRDTHFNRRGNEVAGRALAQLVRQLLRR